MGSSCSSGQAHKDKDSVSTRSEESPSYQITCKKPSQGSLGNHSATAQHSGVILEASTVAAQHLRNNGANKPTPVSPSAIQMDHRPMATKAIRNIAISSASCDSMSLSSPPGTSTQSPRDWLQFPQPVQRLSENLHHLLMGRVAAARTAVRTGKIVIYVCAADSQDCCCEKKVLHTVVYPALRARCEGRELHIVDLHWKTGLEKQQDHEFPDLCLGELARHSTSSYVIPVLFLSNSLGTPLLPHTVETQDYEVALKSADDAELLNKWYGLDSHAQPPCYRLTPISKLPGFKENSVEQKEQALREWRTEIERTLAVMVEVFPQELRDTYLTTVVEQEVHNTVCMSQELARRCLWVNRVYTLTNQSEQAAHTNAQSSAGEAELKRRLENLHKDLKTQLAEKHILRVAVPWSGGTIDDTLPEHAAYLSTITQQLTDQLLTIIDDIIEDHDKVVLKPSYGIDSSLLNELMQQTSYCQRAAQCGSNRETVIEQLKTYLTDDSRSVLVTRGSHGSGMSTLLARVAQCCHTWLPDSALMIRFVSVTVSSTTTEQVLASIANQCSVLSTGSHVWDTHNVESYTALLPRLLAAAGLTRRQIVIIDGIDQVRDYGTQSLEWLPRELPDNVKMIVSIAEDSAMYRSHSADIEDKRMLVQMPPLDKSEADAILMASVMQYNHSVNSKVQDCVRASVQTCTLPLYIKVLAWQTSWWTDVDHEMTPLGDVVQQVVQMLEELENILDRDKLSHALALMTASKAGLSDSEMLDLLAHEPAFHSKETYVLWAPACLFWARLNKHLAPFVQWSVMGGAVVLQWRDALMREVVRQRYLGQEAQCRAASTQIVQYFKGEWANETSSGILGRMQPQPNKTEHSYNRRKLDQLPFQCYQLTGFIPDEYLLDHEWLYDKLCGSDVDQVLEDISLAEHSPRGRTASLSLLRDFLERHAPALAYDGRQLYSQLHAYLSRLPPPHDAYYRHLLAVCSAPPVPCLLPLTPLAGREEEGEGEGGDVPRYDAVVSLGVENYVVTLSTEREELVVWSIRECERVRVLKGVTQPISLQPVDSRRCVVLCRRELRVVDLDEGRFDTRLKGVMNQKMPYYGLHDKDHLVALSRNRMYVNLMNVVTGDCVTTFKVGEDRFLNSLLVSGDGKVLVCGDETQKPFPLLVWNLASRKLLYDLRIPHHDFVTSLSAITHEGHFVCCVATEVDEPQPNFIVVYDLQSGTLFKKWKPGVDTVSLAISSKDACVVSGLEDARILVWDLVTGNCRLTLAGHTAPVNFLRLDHDGGALLSADSLGRDRSLRLWDLNKGDLLAVYTPPRPVSCCEVSSGPHGRFVVIAVRGQSRITSLELRGPGVAAAQHAAAAAQRTYGRAEHKGRTFDLADTDAR